MHSQASIMHHAEIVRACTLLNLWNINEDKSGNEWAIACTKLTGTI